MTIWERSLSVVYAAACVWDGLRKSVRPIAADALRTLASKIDSGDEETGASVVAHATVPPLEEIGDPQEPEICLRDGCRFGGTRHYGTHVIDYANGPVIDVGKFKFSAVVMGPRDKCPACWGEGGHRTSCYRCGVVG